ncbi:hypothetical protein J2129_001026 [Methanofollis sp. W23]|nr:hypothetical protein [Methanofollis sp. W23]
MKKGREKIKKRGEGTSNQNAVFTTHRGLGHPPVQTPHDNVENGTSFFLFVNSPSSTILILGVQGCPWREEEGRQVIRRPL